MAGAIVVGLLLIGLGVVSFIGRDLMWSLTEWSNSWRGVASERSDGWELNTTISGVVSLLFGAGLVIFAITTGVNDARETDDATATATAHFAALEATYAPIIPTLRSDAGSELKRADAAVFGLPADQKMFYAYCGGDVFLLYIGHGFTGDAYLSDGSRSSCSGQGWGTTFRDPLGQSQLGGVWGVGSLSNVGTAIPVVTATPAPNMTPTVAATEAISG